MTVIAIAGGTGNVGRTILEALIASGLYEVKILSRQPNPELEAKLGAPIIQVDYSDVKGLTKVLEENNVHTLISALTMIPGPNSAPKEIELIRAADASKTTKRMISSEWGLPHDESHIGMLPTVTFKLDAYAELKKVTDLETTRFYTGYFMDYWGMPAVKSHMPYFPLFVDIPNNFAAIPGSGNTPIATTHSTDLAKFVVASLNLPKWDPDFFIINERVTVNEVVRLVEDAKGVKIDVTYDSTEKLKGGEPTELPGYIPIYDFIPKPFLQHMAATFGLWADQGVLDLKAEKTLNTLFPDIQTMSVKDLVNKAWKKP